MIEVFLIFLEASQQNNSEFVDPLIDDASHLTNIFIRFQMIQRLIKSPALLKGLSSRAVGNFYATLASFYFRLIDVVKHPSAPGAMYELMKEVLESDAFSPSLLAKMLKCIAKVKLMIVFLSQIS